MGSYTEFRFRAKLRNDTPFEVLALLSRVIIENDLGLPTGTVFFHSEDVFKPDIDHPFFKCERWEMLFLSTNWDENMQGGKFYFDNRYWVLDIHTEFKNYDNETEKFIDWISPYVVGRKKKQYVGYEKHEMMDFRNNFYIERHGLNNPLP